MDESFYEVVREIRRMNKREQENSRSRPGPGGPYPEKEDAGCCCVLM